MTCEFKYGEPVKVGICKGCSNDVPRNKDNSISRKRMWCSSTCRLLVARNHYWTQARAYALHLNHKAANGDYEYELVRLAYRCARCKHLFEGTLSVYRADLHRPEVNHIKPLYGAGYGPGCAHHQSNLEVLDHQCHLAATAEQRQERG